MKENTVTVITNGSGVQNALKKEPNADHNSEQMRAMINYEVVISSCSLNIQIAVRHQKF